MTNLTIEIEWASKDMYLPSSGHFGRAAAVAARYCNKALYHVIGNFLFLLCSVHVLLFLSCVLLLVFKVCMSLEEPYKE